MPDIKLFRVSSSGVVEIPGRSAQIEKSLQILFEHNLESLLGVKFLASEYSTGKVPGGRIDTLGIDENNCPVIIEFKRAVNENVISQGLFYLDWLLNSKKEFQWLVMEKLGDEVGKKVEWSGPRVLCIAGDFTRYDEYAVRQINRNIELIRYRHHGDDLLLLELVNQTETAARSAETAEAPTLAAAGAKESNANSSDIGYRLMQSNALLKDIFHAIETYLGKLGDDVQVKQLQNYFAFKRIKNFACVELFPQAAKVVVFLKVDPKSVSLEDGFTRDVSNIGHFGTGDLEVTLRTMDDFEKAQPLMLRSYEGA
jgi:predicted transport protein